MLIFQYFLREKVALVSGWWMAGLTLHAQESMGQDPAAQVFFKLFDHKIWQWVADILFDLLLEGEPVVLHQSVKSGLLRLVPGIGVLLEHWVYLRHEGNGRTSNPAPQLASTFR